MLRKHLYIKKFPKVSNKFVVLVESLRTRLEELRTERVDFEKIRDEVIRHLKHVHQRVTLRRKEGLII